MRSDIRGRSIIVDASMAARAEGIRPGMTVIEARTRVPELEVRDRDPDAELRMLESAAELMLAFGSIVELAPPSFLFVEIGRSAPALRKMLGREPTEERVAERIVEVLRSVGHEVCVAVAKDPDTARTVAAHMTEVRRAKLVPPPVERRREVRVRRTAASYSKQAPKKQERGEYSKVSRGRRAAAVVAERVAVSVESGEDAPRASASKRAASPVSRTKGGAVSERAAAADLDVRVPAGCSAATLSAPASASSAPASASDTCARARAPAVSASAFAPAVSSASASAASASAFAPAVSSASAPAVSSASAPAVSSASAPAASASASAPAVVLAPLDPVIIPPAREHAILGRLPVDALLWTDPRDDPDGSKRERLLAARSSLHVLGIHDVARLKSLPSAQVSTRFGDAGALLMQRAHARLDRPLRPYAPRERIIEEYELDAPVEELEPILFVLRRLFSRLEARLEGRALSTRTVTLAIAVEPRSEDGENAIDADADRAPSSRRVELIELGLARPTRKASTMLAIAREKLGGTLPGAVCAIVAEARAPARDHGAQLDLFSAYPRKLEEVGELVGRLSAALGDEAVFSPQIQDTHRPEAAWSRRPFGIEQALEEPVVRPSRAKPLVLAKTSDILESTHVPYMLPEVNDDLCVAEMPRRLECSVESVLAELAEKKKSWPRAIERKLEDDPLPPLPPRPLELYAPPERVMLHAPRAGAQDAAFLEWRGERVRLRSLGGSERLEAEWWTVQPLAREYLVAEAEDGRRLWLYFDARGDLFVHGVFD